MRPLPLLLPVVLAPLLAGAAGPVIRVGPEGWGGAPEENIRRLLENVASQFVTHFPHRDFDPVFVSPGGDAPIAHFERTDRGEIHVQLTARGTHWAQFAYQFAHEFCHICCRYQRNRETTNPNRWFEESLCETASLFALRRMAREWAVQAPYANWKEFAPNLESYAEDLLKNGGRTLPAGVSLPAWFRENEASMRTNATLRDRNAVVAGVLLPLFESDPAQWGAVGTLNDGPGAPGQSFAGFLRAWRERAPRRHAALIGRIAREFGIQL